MPAYLAFGVPKKEILHSTLLELKPYQKAAKARRMERDEELHRQGYYNYIALGTALYNAFRDKGVQAKDYIQKPLLLEYEEKHRELTQDEIIKQTNVLFANLNAMQSAFEKSHKTDYPQEVVANP